MPDKNKILYDSLVKDGSYTKSYDEFVNQFSTRDKIIKLHNVLTQDKVYTKPVDTFREDFFSHIDDKPKSTEDVVGSLTQSKDLQPMKWKEDLNYNTIAIPDNRKVDAVTGSRLSDTNKLHSNIDKDVAKHIVEKANEYGIDPYDALATAMQETGFSQDFADNPFRVRFDQWKDEDTQSQGDPIDAAMRVMKKKSQIANSLGKKTDEEKLQGWNGYGKVGKDTEGTQNKMYGIDVSKTPIDMGKNPVYGKRVKDIRDNILKQNPNIVKVIDEYNKAHPLSVLDSIKKQYPAFSAMGDVAIKADTNFTREKTGVGDIEFFSPNQKEVTYNNGLKVPHPQQGKYGIVYNPKTNDQQSIMLDMLHGMKDADPQYAKIRNEFKTAMTTKFRGDLEGEWKDYVKENPNNDGKQQFTENWIDGHIRGLMFEGTPEDFKKHNYWEGERGLYLKDKNIANSFNKLVTHLKKGK